MTSEQYAATKALGLCPKCRRPPTLGRSWCRRCLARQSKATRAKYHAKAATGACPRTGCSNQQAPNRKWCWACLKRQSETRKKYHYVRRAKRVAVIRADRLERPCYRCERNEAMTDQDVCWVCSQQVAQGKAA